MKDFIVSNFPILGYKAAHRSNVWYPDPCIYRDIIELEKRCCGIVKIGLCHFDTTFCTYKKCKDCTNKRPSIEG